MENDVPTDLPPDDYSSSRHWPRATLIRLALTASFLVFAACASLLVYRGITVDVPEGVLIARGSPPWQGCKAVVDGVNLARPETAIFDLGTKCVISFHLAPGDYTFHVERNDKILYTENFGLTKRENVRAISLDANPDDLSPTSRPTWPPAHDRMSNMGLD